MMYFELGNTQLLQAEFYDWNDPSKLIDPDSIKFIVYDGRFNVLETIQINVSNKTDIGKYQLFYTPNKTGTLIYEWNGMIDGFPSISREKIEIKQVL